MCTSSSPFPLPLEVLDDLEDCENESSSFFVPLLVSSFPLPLPVALPLALALTLGAGLSSTRLAELSDLSCSLGCSGDFTLLALF